MEKYFENKKEPRSGALKEFPDILHTELYEFKPDKNGFFESKKENLSFQFQCTNYQYPDQYDNWKESGWPESDKTKILGNFRIEDESGNVVDLSEYIGKYKILLSPVFERVGEANLNQKIVKMKDISTPAQVLILLHEIGHLNYIEQLEENDPEKAEKLKKITPEILKTDQIPQNAQEKMELEKSIDLKYEEERIAWAFAINKLRPIIDKEGLFSREAVTRFVHDFCLQKYSRRFGTRINSLIGATIDFLLEKNLERRLNE
jgi:hypothetical protein